MASQPLNRQQLNDLRKTYAPLVGESHGANAAIALLDEIDRYRRAIDQIGFRFAGTADNAISQRCLAVLRGETMDGLPIQPHHIV